MWYFLRDRFLCVEPAPTRGINTTWSCCVIVSAQGLPGFWCWSLSFCLARVCGWPSCSVASVLAAALSPLAGPSGCPHFSDSTRDFSALCPSTVEGHVSLRTSRPTGQARQRGDPINASAHLVTNKYHSPFLHCPPSPACSFFRCLSVFSWGLGCGMAVPYLVCLVWLHLLDPSAWSF